jgi:PAS domain S-box-containing protein
VKLPDGKFMAFCNDITDRKQAEEIIKNSEEKYRNLFYNVQVGIYRTKIDGSEILDFNEHYLKIFERTRDEMVNTPSIVHWADPSERADMISRLKNDGSVVNFECQMLTKNGKIKNCLTSVRLYEEENILEGSIIDITERKQIETELIKTKEKAEESERKIKEQSQEIENFFSCTIDLFCIANTQGNFIRLNKEWENTLGYTLGELEGKKFLDFIHPDDINSSLQAIAQLDKQINITTFTNRYRCKDGSYKWIEWKSYPYGNKIYAAARDITSRKQLEESLLQKTTFFETLLNTATDGILIVDENGRKVFQNQRMIDLLNIPKEFAENIDDQFQLQYVTSINKNPEEFAAKVLYLYNHPLETSRDEIELKDGKVFDRYSAPVIGVNGHHYGRIWIFRDITESKHTEKALIKAKEKAEESEIRFKSITEQAMDGITLADLNGKYQFVNSAFSNIVGYTKDELLQMYVYDLKPNNLESTLFDETKQKGIGARTNYLLECKDGKLIYADITGKKININNEELILGIVRNVTERVKSENNLIIAKEKAEESDRLKTAFLQNMSHEIRTPMNAIMGFSDLLFTNADNKPKLKKFTEIISERCNDLLDIINDILDISKIESGQLPVNIEECNLVELFAELSAFFTEYQKRINKQHIKFSLEALCDPSENIIITDKVKLKQIFINLISNAFKFTDVGKVEGGCKFDENNNLLFYVSDTGIGIPADKKDYIFERFTQLHQNLQKNIGGTGLGLSIVKGLIGLLGGEISVESEPNKGSTFSFTFPCKMAQIISQPQSSSEMSIVKNIFNSTILIVEDDFYNAEYIKEILSGIGLTILLAENGQEAIEKALSQPVDLVLMDIRLPDINGYEATLQIKKNKPDIKIIAQTAYAASDEKQKAFDAGCIDYISKPIKQGALLTMLNKHLLL